MVMNVMRVSECACVRVCVCLPAASDRGSCWCFMFISSVKTQHAHTFACYRAVVCSSVTGQGGCCWCHPVIPMTSICGRRPARPASAPSAGPATTSKIWRGSSGAAVRWPHTLPYTLVLTGLIFMDPFEQDLELEHTDTAIYTSSTLQTRKNAPTISDSDDLAFISIFSNFL